MSSFIGATPRLRELDLRGVTGLSKFNNQDCSGLIRFGSKECWRNRDAAALELNFNDDSILYQICVDNVDEAIEVLDGVFDEFLISNCDGSENEIVEIPDDNFKHYLLSLGIDNNNDGEIQKIEAPKLHGRIAI